MLNPNEVALITTAPHNFAGAGTAHIRALCLLSQAGYETHYLSLGESFHAKALHDANVNIVRPAIHSDAYPTSDSLQVLSMVNAMVGLARNASARNKKIVLLGTFLYPYVGIAVEAARILRRDGIEAAVIAQPAGSDIWQIGAQIPECTRSMFSSGDVTSVVSFSVKFCDEIREYCDSRLDPVVIPPAVDTRRFSPLSSDERIHARHRLGIREDETVVLACSNMRPVKGIDVVLQLVEAVAARHARRILLLLVGPITQHLRDAFEIYGLSLETKSLAVPIRNMTVRLLDLQHDTTIYHQISDIAINASYHDSFNISLAESLSCGIPVVSSDVVGVADVIRSADSGLLFSYLSLPLEQLRTSSRSVIAACDIAGISARICKLLDDKEQLRSAGERGRNAIVNLCGREEVRKKWVQLIRHAIDRCHADRHENLHASVQHGSCRQISTMVKRCVSPDGY